ncbi:GNAT family N-acetyltransferase [Amnibacterium sp. CER49]|uniref:GNAT family N-acetyltransferase n=1 Tax=Amnibacterium sp. CER49 TaxID=3039161 RepID=UPI00244CCC9C|nr:GNAT family N-acetyltransferase [Amnibacterium sp. CER49]MDH2443340.1 GNAT family N-acetyltransferase [Amnibacterium sp. CER49]
MTDEGRAVRRATEADEAALARLLGESFDDPTWSAERVQGELTRAADVLAVFVVEDEDGLVATASARSAEKFPGLGYVHWVGVSPQKRGQRLGRVVVEQVVAHFDAMGIGGVILETDDVRLPALATYLGLGFVPEYLDEDHRRRWSAVFSALSGHKGRKGNAR